MPAEGPVTRRTRTGLAPLRRRPKELDADPVLFDASQGGAGGLVLSAGNKRPGRPAGAAGPGSGAPGITGEPAQLIGAAPAGVEPDPETIRRARQIAARLAVPRPRRDVLARRGAGELASVRYRDGSDDIDLDATLESLAEHPVPDDDDIIVRERVRTRRSVVLAVDVSGSMRGERVSTAAATVGALAAELERDDLAVLAFWSDAAVLARLGQHVPAGRLLDALLRIPARGLTNISFPLQIARQQLARIPARDARVLLLSDCVHNAGPIPGPPPPGWPGWTCCSILPVSTTRSSRGTWPGPGTGGWPGSAVTATSPRPSPGCSPGKSTAPGSEPFGR